MPEMRTYEVEVEVTVRVREKSSQMTLASMTLADKQKANSYDPQQMISAVVAETLGDMDKKMMSHVRRVEDVERAKK